MADSSLPPLETILRDNPGWLDEAVTPEEASRITAVPTPTLTTKRSRGGGPEFVKLGGCVRYTRRALFSWLRANARRNTVNPAPDGPPASDET